MINFASKNGHQRQAESGCIASGLFRFPPAVTLALRMASKVSIPPKKKRQFSIRRLSFLFGLFSIHFSLFSKIVVSSEKRTKWKNWQLCSAKQLFFILNNDIIFKNIIYMVIGGLFYVRQSIKTVCSSILWFMV